MSSIWINYGSLSLIVQQLSEMRRDAMLSGMKTILWATLTANGNYARSSQRHTPKPEATADFAAHAREHGNFIVGRQTFLEFQENASRRPQNAPLEGIDIVVVSSTLALPPGAPARTATDPRAALALLRERGHQVALVVGGERLHNAFLGAGLVDEIIVVVTPSLEDEGRRIVLPRDERREATLIEHKPLGGGLIRLRYALGPADTW
ncbi:dihydrofolate reductase family protein [Pendulispora brunnea]|uniref:Dihydrofolate reductase family protein n=1 Tax=Pendulispora brunnea TaxID=2905690 RepID=A0ABZ2K079_9BACT